MSDYFERVKHNDLTVADFVKYTACQSSTRIDYLRKNLSYFDLLRYCSDPNISLSMVKRMVIETTKDTLKDVISALQGNENPVIRAVAILPYQAGDIDILERGFQDEYFIVRAASVINNKANELWLADKHFQEPELLPFIKKNGGLNFRPENRVQLAHTPSALVTLYATIESTSRYDHRIRSQARLIRDTAIPNNTSRARLFYMDSNGNIMAETLSGDRYEFVEPGNWKLIA